MQIGKEMGLFLLLMMLHTQLSNIEPIQHLQSTFHQRISQFQIAATSLAICVVRVMFNTKV